LRYNVNIAKIHLLELFIEITAASFVLSKFLTRIDHEKLLLISQSIQDQITFDRHPRLTAIASLSTTSSSLNSLFRVLCIFPSRYLCAIGLPPIFSLGWRIPPFSGCTLKQPYSKTNGTFQSPNTPSRIIDQLTRDCHPL